MIIIKLYNYHPYYDQWLLVKLAISDWLAYKGNVIITIYYVLLLLLYELWNSCNFGYINSYFSWLSYHQLYCIGLSRLSLLLSFNVIVIG